MTSVLWGTRIESGQPSPLAVYATQAPSDISELNPVGSRLPRRRTRSEVPRVGGGDVVAGKRCSWVPRSTTASRGGACGMPHLCCRTVGADCRHHCPQYLTWPIIATVIAQTLRADLNEHSSGANVSGQEAGCPPTAAKAGAALHKCGAGDENRTRVSSLGSWRSTIELHRRKPPKGRRGSHSNRRPEAYRTPRRAWASPPPSLVLRVTG